MPGPSNGECPEICIHAFAGRKALVIAFPAAGPAVLMAFPWGTACEKASQGSGQGTAARAGPESLSLDMAFVSPARYPLAITDHLPTDRPTAHKLMGKELVVWRDGQGEWRVMEDSCPHR